MKKSLTLIMVLLASTLVLTACGGGNSGSSKSSSPKTEKSSKSSETSEESSSSEEASSSESEKTMDASQINDNDQLTEYLKETENVGSYVKSVTTVSDVPTVELQNVSSLSKPVYFEYIAQLFGRMKGAPIAKNGAAVVQVSEYQNSAGAKADAMDFAFYFAPTQLQATAFDQFQHTVFQDPKQLYTTASGYYLQKDFVKDGMQYMPNTDLMKLDDQSLMTTFMDKFGA